MDPALALSLIIIATGMLVATPCALLGTFLVLRRMAMVGDAISHAVLPGIAIGYAVTLSRQPIVMLIGAAIAGLITVWLIETLHRTRRVHEDTSIAVVFPALFALGVVLIERFAHYVDLDADCVFLGNIEAAVPGRLPLLGIVTALVIGFVICFYKELKLCTFDAGLGETLGFRPTRMHYLLMGLVSMTTVAAFEAVGAVLVVSFLIVPAATAYLLTDRLWKMLILAVLFGLIAAVTGFFVAREEALNCNVAGAMASMAGVWFGMVWLTAPKHGLWATLSRRRRLRERFAADLFLLHLQQHGPLSEPAHLYHERFGWRAGQGQRVLRDLTNNGLIVSAASGWKLTARGEAAAEVLNRAYRP